MSLVFQYAFLNVVLIDEAKNNAGMKLALDYVSLDTLNTAFTGGAITQIITDLEAITDALVASYNVGVRYQEDTAVVGGANSEVENVALISALLDGFIDKRASLRIPAPVIGIFMTATGEGKNIVDVSDTALQTWLAHFETSGEITVSDGESIQDSATAGTFKGKRIHRGSNRG